MKTERIQSAPFRLVLLAGALLAWSGVIGVQGSTAVDLTALRKSLGDLQAQVSDTTSALEGLKRAGKEGGDLKKNYATFAEKLKTLESSLEKVRAEGTQIRTKTEEHYKAWQNELAKMGNPKLREKALNRYDDAKEEFDQIIVVAEQAKQEIGPFMSDLKDVGTYLKSDLSADALKSLSNSIWKLGNKARAVVGSLQHVSNQISRTLDQLPQE